eukprot:TRINITY_DN25780_c0_g1_i1.p1 TRINITY_DN25780_c0_g1~~TRINITY_DN25780_c0_g1_i1.p1  ORF type:complete len:540 (+),score=77.38 TRINITY_DN25780_c0_g1_i1:83-1702(+)
MADLCKKHPLPAGITFGYGTSGFRTVATNLDGPVFRVGITAALRARQTKQNTGIMITASHNPHQDNGVKIIDGNGEMLATSWEKHATALANAQTWEDLEKEVQRICTEEKIEDTDATKGFKVLIARDTRPSGVGLLTAAADGATSIGQKSQDLGIMTTPEAHFVVQRSNFADAPPVEEIIPTYVSTMCDAFKALVFGTAEPKSLGITCVIDCANGVGTKRMPQLEAELKDVLSFQTINTNIDNPQILNDLCGADFVQKELKPPANVTAANEASPQHHTLTFDGDADRIIYFTFDKEGNCKLLDGDKMLTLFCVLIKKQLEILNLPDLTIGAVQTAYANGGSTHYISNTLKVPVSLVPTGVKHLHHKAHDYDIGAYFEANGHGTVIFSQQFKEKVSAANCDTEEKKIAQQRLLWAAKVLHPTAGDAIADALMIEACLALLQWDIKAWLAVYDDLPSRQLKVQVPDPKKVKTLWDETRVTEPAALQEKIDALVKGYGASARAFVRPSGTEPVVRVYAEATTRAEADKLADEVKAAIVEVLQ